jgi:hypothetical protein
LKLLNAAHVNPDITVAQFDGVCTNFTMAQFDGVCNNITTSRCLGFIDVELAAEGQAHNGSLHISMKCQYNTIARELLDMGSSLNVMPTLTLVKLCYWVGF